MVLILALETDREIQSGDRENNFNVYNGQTPQCGVGFSRVPAFKVFMVSESLERLRYEVERVTSKRTSFDPCSREGGRGVPGGCVKS